jgi:hypothetical protein
LVHLELRRLDGGNWLAYLVDVRRQEGPSPVEFPTFDLAMEFTQEVAIQAFGQVLESPAAEMPPTATGVTMHLRAAAADDPSLDDQWPG